MLPLFSFPHFCFLGGGRTRAGCNPRRGLARAISQGVQVAAVPRAPALRARGAALGVRGLGPTGGRFQPLRRGGTGGSADCTTRTVRRRNQRIPGEWSFFLGIPEFSSWKYGTICSWDGFVLEMESTREPGLVVREFGQIPLKGYHGKDGKEVSEKVVTGQKWAFFLLLFFVCLVFFFGGEGGGRWWWMNCTQLACIIRLER